MPSCNRITRHNPSGVDKMSIKHLENKIRQLTELADSLSDNNYMTRANLRVQISYLKEAKTLVEIPDA